MFEVQFRSTSTCSASRGREGCRWSTYWTSACPQDAAEYLRQMTVAHQQQEWRLRWVEEVPLSRRETKLLSA